MADFGRLVLNCGPRRPSGGWRLLPTPGCRSAYEEWTAALDVGGALRGRPGFAIQNPITQLDPADPSRVIFNKAAACGFASRASRAAWRTCSRWSARATAGCSAPGAGQARPASSTAATASCGQTRPCAAADTRTAGDLVAGAVERPAAGRP